MKVFITGVAGFIGASLAKKLLENGYNVIGIDNLNEYYDVNLKKARLKFCSKYSKFEFHQLDIRDKDKLYSSYYTSDVDVIVHLAAQAGVRHSIENPEAYIETNVNGFGNMLEMCRAKPIKHFIFASSSSVYGANTKFPLCEDDNVDHPISLYAATKKANEAIAHSYAHLFNIPLTGLRFFTVYGPWGRPDMALFKFCRNIMQNLSIDVYNHGKMLRDFTFIDDVTEAITRLLTCPPDKGGSLESPATSNASYRILNIGNGNPQELKSLINLVEKNLNTKANLNLMPMQPGDVKATRADINKLKQLTGFSPQVSLEEGVFKFVNWYREYITN